MSKSVITTSLALVLAMTMVLAVGKTLNGEEEEPAPMVAQAVIPVDEEVTPVSQAPSSRLTVMPDVEQGDVILDIPSQSAADERDSLMVSLAKVKQALAQLQALARETDRAVSALERQRSSL